MAIRVPNTLSFRLTCWYAATFALALILALLLSYFALGKFLQDEVAEDLVSDVEEFNLFYANDGLAAVQREIDIEVSGGNHANEFFLVLDNQGQIVIGSDLSAWARLQPDKSILARLVTEPELVAVTSVELPQREYPATVVYGRIGPEYRIIIGESLEQTHAF